MTIDTWTSTNAVPTTLTSDVGTYNTDLSAVAFSIDAGAWWMQRVCFTPDDTRATAAAMLEEPDIQAGRYNIHWLEKWLARETLPES